MNKTKKVLTLIFSIFFTALITGTLATNPPYSAYSFSNEASWSAGASEEGRIMNSLSQVSKDVASKISETINNVSSNIIEKKEKLFAKPNEEDLAKKYKDDFWNRPDFWEKEIEWRKHNENKTVDELIDRNVSENYVKIIDKDVK